MMESQVFYGTLALVTLFIILELLQQRRELGYHALSLPKDPRPLKPRSPSTAPFVAGPIPNRFGGMLTSLA